MLKPLTYLVTIFNTYHIVLRSIQLFKNKKMMMTGKRLFHHIDYVI